MVGIHLFIGMIVIFIIAVETNIGISTQPTMFACRNPSLSQIMTNNRLPSSSNWVTSHKDIRNAQRIRVVVDFICQILAKQKGSQ